MSEAPIIVKKKKSHGHAHHGGSWKVAYADFVTAMMAFFMVMWIMGLSDDVKIQIQGYFNDPLGFMKNQPRSKSSIAMKSFPNTRPGQSQKSSLNTAKHEEEEHIKAGQIKEKIKEALQKSGDLKELLKNIDITITPEGLRIELLESTGSVFFESGRAVIRPDALKLIRDKMAPILSKTGHAMILEGHTDAKPYGGTNYTNWELSEDRANALRRALEDGGVTDEQVMGVRGYAAKELRVPTDPYHYSNRRVSILLPFKESKDVKVDLPKEQMSNQIQGLFHAPSSLDVAQPAPIRDPAPSTQGIETSDSVKKAGKTEDLATKH